LDRQFRKSFGQDENRITESCKFLDARHTHLCQGTSVVNSCHGHGNAFSLDTDLTEVSAIDKWDPETHQVVRSSDVVFNESTMHKSANRPIELRRGTFSDVPTPLDGPTQHRSSDSRSAHPLSTEGAVPDKHSSSSATISPTRSDKQSSDVRSTIALEPASPVVPRRSERLCPFPSVRSTRRES
jgi:hypothetical protein